MYEYEPSAEEKSLFPLLVIVAPLESDMHEGIYAT